MNRVAITIFNTQAVAKIATNNVVIYKWRALELTANQLIIISPNNSNTITPVTERLIATCSGADKIAAERIISCSIIN